MEYTDEDYLVEEIPSEKKDSESSPPNFEILTYPADYTLEVLFQKWNNKEILIPDFQRSFVWTQNQASKLIESFLIGLPVPAVFLYLDQNSDLYSVIDGQQRLLSVFAFFSEVFPSINPHVRSAFKLTGLDGESPYYRKTFSSLSENDRRKFLNSILRAFIVKQLDPNDDTSMFHIFQRLNSGGTNLNNQEIRNCIYYGPFSKALERFNEVKSWRSILGKPVADRRKRDIELILRFLAMRDLSSYKNTMKDFLSHFMKSYRYADQRQIEEFESTFRETCNSVVKHLHDRPFHTSTRLNAAVFDSVMVAFSKNLDCIPDDIELRFRELLSNESFLHGIKSHTTDLSAIEARFGLANEMIVSSGLERHPNGK